MVVRTRTPDVVATGFTSAFLGDERTLREFVVGDAVAREHESRGQNTVLYLINDTYDPLNSRQLRLGVNKDTELIKLWSGFCGRAIAEVPDPFDCHPSYAEHFASALLSVLHSLDIYPSILDSYRAYSAGDYRPFLETTIRQYAEIQHAIRTEFPGFEPHDLIRVQCARCSCLDGTSVREVGAHGVAYECRGCGFAGRQSTDRLRGKLSWKLDCAARWNLYGVHVETFAKSHMAPLGTYRVAALVSERFFGGIVPEAAQYGHVRISPECSGRLLAILPPLAFKHLFGDGRTRDLLITRESVENFGRRYKLHTGISYVDFVRSTLPHQAIFSDSHDGADPAAAGTGASDADPNLVRYANAFSAFCYGKTYRLRLPNVDSVASTDLETAAAALDCINHALALRRHGSQDPEQRKDEIKLYLAALPPITDLHGYLRRIFGQEAGPAVATLLAMLPTDYLDTIGAMLVFMTAANVSERTADTNLREVA